MLKASNRFARTASQEEKTFSLLNYRIIRFCWRHTVALGNLVSCWRRVGLSKGKAVAIKQPCSPMPSPPHHPPSIYIYKVTCNYIPWPKAWAWHPVIHQTWLIWQPSEPGPTLLACTWADWESPLTCRTLGAVWRIEWESRSRQKGHDSLTCAKSNPSLHCRRRPCKPKFLASKTCSLGVERGFGLLMVACNKTNGQSIECPSILSQHVSPRKHSHTCLIEPSTHDTTGVWGIAAWTCNNEALSTRWCARTTYHIPKSGLVSSRKLCFLNFLDEDTSI